MSDFCRQCSIETFGQDSYDLAVPAHRCANPDDLFVSLCEGCGEYILHDRHGVCVAYVSHYCQPFPWLHDEAPQASDR
jgi:hypothetical protein